MTAARPGSQRGNHYMGSMCVCEGWFSRLWGRGNPAPENSRQKAAAARPATGRCGGRSLAVAVACCCCCDVLRIVVEVVVITTIRNFSPPVRPVVEVADA